MSSYIDFPDFESSVYNSGSDDDTEEDLEEEPDDDSTEPDEFESQFGFDESDPINGDDPIPNSNVDAKTMLDELFIKKTEMLLGNQYLVSFITSFEQIHGVEKIDDILQQIAEVSRDIILPGKTKPDKATTGMICMKNYFDRQRNLQTGGGKGIHQLKRNIHNNIVNL
jgi:hypothetical protein